MPVDMGVPHANLHEYSAAPLPIIMFIDDQVRETGMRRRNIGIRLRRQGSPHKLRSPTPTPTLRLNNLGRNGVTHRADLRREVAAR